MRKKAASVVRDVLASPPIPLARHPYAEAVADWVKSELSKVNSGPFPRAKAPDPSGAETAIHVLAFLRPVLSHLPPPAIPSLVNMFLMLPRLGNTYLSQSVYSIMSDLFSLSLEDGSSHVNAQLSDILAVIISSPPSKSDSTLSPAWVQVLGNAMLAYAAVDADACANEIGKVWRAVWTFLESNDPSTRKAASQSLAAICRCFTPALILAASGDETSRSTLDSIVAQLTRALHSFTSAQSMPQLLSIISSLITGLQYRAGSRTSLTAAEHLLLPVIQYVGELRVQKGFEYKEDVDAALAAAMRVLGPEVLLGVLPLNLEPSDRQAGREPRAFILPLLSQPHPSPLRHFVTYFVPLSERMFDLQQAAESEGRQSEAKVWSVLVGQVWSGLVGYCWGAPDLKEAFNPSFSQLLSQLLYSQPDLRPAVLRALKAMVDSNVASATPTVDRVASSNTLSPSEAASNIDYLRTQAESWLAVLFNVFASVSRDGQGVVGDVISSWASITGEQEIAKAYEKVSIMFKDNLANAASVPQSDKKAGGVTTATQDILILLLPYLSPSASAGLFRLCLSNSVLGGKDNGVQKRGYKILTKLVESRRVIIDAEVTLRQLDEFVTNLAPAAKKDRFALLALLVSSIPSSAMHIIPSLIPEAVLGTKEPSEKARNFAFELIVSMGRKMSKGGVVKRSLIDGMEEDGVSDAVATVEEFMTMVAGGLAGATPHMISATVTAISRLVFEFKDAISAKMHTEILTTMLVFLSSTNREIVKSVLGFVKLVIHTLPTDLVEPHLKELIPTLLARSHDHKNHFKVKVRHIFERILRRFTWDKIYSYAGEDEAAKVLVNIKKRKDRAKRKKASQNEDSDDEMPPTKAATGDAFEDVLYGSESELDDSEDDEAAGLFSSHPKRTSSARGARLRLDDDEPMDLLQGAASRITNVVSNHRKPGQEAHYFKTDNDTGKMIIDAHDELENEDAAMTDVGGAAYRESITSVDGFSRGPNGRIKFNKNTKKRRREIDEIDDEMVADGDGGIKSKKNERKANFAKLGHEFKAKKAGGDVKKGGVDPYAYMPLSQAAKKGALGKRTHIGVTGKR